MEESVSGPGRDLERIREDANACIKKSQRYNEERAALRRVSVKSFDVGDFMVVRNVDTTVGLNKKLLPKYKGPYVIHKVLPNDRYVVRDIENCQVTQIPYNGVIEACNIRPRRSMDSWNSAKGGSP